MARNQAQGPRAGPQRWRPAACAIELAGAFAPPQRSVAAGTARAATPTTPRVCSRAVSLLPCNTCVPNLSLAMLFLAYCTRIPSCSPCADQARLAQCPHCPTHAGQDMPRASTRWAQRLAVHHTDREARVQSVEQESCCCGSVSVYGAIVNAHSTDLWRPTPARAAALPTTIRHALRALSPPSPCRAPPPGSVGC